MNFVGAQGSPHLVHIRWWEVAWKREAPGGVVVAAVGPSSCEVLPGCESAAGVRPCRFTAMGSRPEADSDEPMDSRLSRE